MQRESPIPTSLPPTSNLRGVCFLGREGGVGGGRERYFSRMGIPKARVLLEMWGLCQQRRERRELVGWRRIELGWVGEF